MSTSFADRLTAARERAGLSQKAAAEALPSLGVKVSERSLAGYERGEREPGLPKQTAILQALDSLVHSAHGEDAPVPHLLRDPIYLPAVGAGEGDDLAYYVREDPIGYISGPDALSRPGRRVAWFLVKGDSMPGYPKGSLVPVHLFDEHPRDVTEDDVFLFRMENALQIKRLQRLPGQRLRIISDNAAYPVQELEINEAVDFAIIGRVVA